uniref:Propionyl-CoA carboxylase alpha chain, mitochondrial n=1 Tax=Haptolina ericina TaxID=156174 RepID=A0A7S3ETA5_9EUKA
MLKASAGGGGKGMRIAWNDEETASGFALSAREAAASFGDDRIFIERFVVDPRHIEIQLVADRYGNCIYLPERECSIQRRNQKVVEEAPAAHLSSDAVRRMGEEAVALAKAVGYRSAGTVEFLVDSQERHYFLEMNTRLQVEHPVTELVAGLDLVELMIRVAAGEKLPLTQSQVTRTGWAFESRVYAEDPLRGFLPSTGVLSTYRPPTQEQVVATMGDGATAEAGSYDGIVRVDDGVREGGEISMHYDPMISKLIVHGRDREHARQLMLASLDRYQIRGVRHNLNFLRSLMAHPRFAAGSLTTSFIPEEYPDGYAGHVLTEDERCDLFACTAVLQTAADMQAATVGRPNDATHPSSSRYLIEIEGEIGSEVIVRVPSPPLVGLGLGDVLIEGCELTGDTSDASTRWSRVMRVVSSGMGPDALMEVQFGNPAAADPAAAVTRPMAVQVVERRPLKWQLSAFGTLFSLHARPPRFSQLATHMKPPPPPPFADALVSPMPGALLSVSVAVGEDVVEGQEICVVEAMKMQNVLFAPRTGKVRALLAEPGSVLVTDQPIVDFE